MENELMNVVESNLEETAVDEIEQNEVENYESQEDIEAQEEETSTDGSKVGAIALVGGGLAAVAGIGYAIKKHQDKKKAKAKELKVEESKPEKKGLKEKIRETKAVWFPPKAVKTEVEEADSEAETNK